jgi:co-chaperonin GroES (HSP10)
MKVKPLADRILVKRVDSATQTKGGLYIPDSAKENKIDGEDHLIIREDDVLGIVTEG